MNEMPLLRVSGLRSDVGSRTLWQDIELELGPGDSIALRGVSGSGKSTLLRCLGGIERPAHGSVRIVGVDVQRGGANARALRRDVVGFVMQDHAIVPEWSVEQNLAVVRPTGVPRTARLERIGAALLAVGLGGRGRQRAGALSGGEQQRIAVARLLVQRPRVVLADEPTASLDTESATRVRSALDLLRSNGAAVVVATHDEALSGWAGRVLHLGGCGARRGPQ